MFKDLVKDFDKQITTYNVGDTALLLKKFSAYDKLLLNKTVIDNGEEHPTVIAQIVRAGLNEDISGLTDEQVLQTVESCPGLVTEILKHNSMYDKPSEDEKEPVPGKSKRAPKSNSKAT